MNSEQYKKQLEEILELAIKKDATDVHLSAGRQPILRIDGQLIPLDKRAALTEKDTQELAFTLLSEERKEQFLSQKDIDLSFAFQDKARFRINIYKQLSKISVALRLIPSKIRTIEELNLSRLEQKELNR